MKKIRCPRVNGSTHTEAIKRFTNNQIDYSMNGGK